MQRCTLAGRTNGVSLKNLSCAELELSGREHLPLPHVLLLPHGQIFPESGPDRLDGIQIATVWREPSIRPAILLPVVRQSAPPVRMLRGYPGALSGVFHGYMMGVSYGYPMALSGVILGYPMGILGYPLVSYAIWRNQHFRSTIQS